LHIASKKPGGLDKLNAPQKNIAILVNSLSHELLDNDFIDLSEYSHVTKVSEAHLGVLDLTKEQAEFKSLLEPKLGAIFVDFVRGKAAHRRLYGGGKRQPLARAVGMKKKPYPRILDLSAGLGRDAFVLATLGCEVVMLERSPIVAALLADGLRRAADDIELSEIVCQRMWLLPLNALDYLNDKSKQVEPPDVIYFDPMYPEREKSALVKKEMRVLQMIAGKDEDAATVLSRAVQVASRRVVVKRPLKAPTLNELKPATQIKSKNTRYDIYFPA